jgi:hypothetical protein
MKDKKKKSGMFFSYRPLDRKEAPPFHKPDLFFLSPAAILSIVLSLSLPALSQGGCSK